MVRVVRADRANRVPAKNPIFVGAVDEQRFSVEGMTDLSIGEIHFKNGAVNKPHVHSTDQILIITEGEGIVATDSEKHEVQAGDVAFIPVNTKHWHGARPGKDMTHLSILGRDSKTTISD